MDHSRHGGEPTPPWRRRVGLQAFTLGPMTTSQLTPSLAQLRTDGVELVEFLYDWIDQSAAELRSALDQAGLRCPSVKVPPAPWATGGPSLERDLGRVVSDAHTLGVDYVVAMMFSPPGGAWPQAGADETPLGSIERVGRALTLGDWGRNAAQLNHWGAELRREGLRLAYHNTNFEFADLGGACGLQILLNETDPDLVSFELDTGYALSGGADPVELLRRHGGRFALLHLKDLAPSEGPNHRCFQANWTDLGQGVGDWPAIIAAAEAGGAAYYYLEQEPPFTSTPMAAVRAGLSYLDQLAAEPNAALQAETRPPFASSR